MWNVVPVSVRILFLGMEEWMNRGKEDFSFRPLAVCVSKAIAASALIMCASSTSSLSKGRIAVTLRDYPQDGEGRLLPDEDVRGSI